MQEMTRSKIKLAFLLLVAFVPITLATFAFRNAGEGGFLSGTVNKGFLINPPADITDLDMRTADGSPIFKSFEEIIALLESDDDYEAQPWHIVYVNTQDCEETCRERVHLLRQMHITLNKNTPRVRRYYLHAATEDLTDPTAQHFRAEFPSMGVAFGNAGIIQNNLSAKGLNLQLADDNYIFFVDPVGNVMMYYTSEHSIADIKADLEKLLRHSSLG
ncbi:hypothetical protein [Pseudohongiella spirulinae]|uniref:Thioredoxin domain-containing protein n=1 Tax=Pseudohongiella spirulinae TaxID=1249552 RepID=A0A0S2K957_9GAMM|nr:hypothetical protein [Pseudohongiella spirulinae]ALO44725.1 hypothetical protein PS2015_27 [Pseudohongiella spirulinae]